MNNIEHNKGKNRVLRQRLGRPGMIVSLGVHDAFSALLAEKAGFEVIFLGGFGISASRLGLPDLNFLNLTDMETAVRHISGVLSIPLIADGDTGHGGLPQVRQTVERLSAAGASGVLLEDQVFPKRCGHFRSKEVISREEMVAKIRTAVAAKPDPDFVVIARTDARAVHGLQDAMDRVDACCQAGADIAFIEAPESQGELEEIARNVKHPLFANMLVGGKTPILSVTELENLGYKFAVSPIETLLVCGTALQSMMTALLKDGRLDGYLSDKMGFDEVKEILRLESFLNIKA